MDTQTNKPNVMNRTNIQKTNKQTKSEPLFDWGCDLHTHTQTHKPMNEQTNKHNLTVFNTNTHTHLHSYSC